MTYYQVSIICLLQLLDVIFREDTLWNVIQSVTRNGRSIILTAILALILVYMFSIIGFLFLKDDFLVETERNPRLHSGKSNPYFSESINHATWVEGQFDPVSFIIIIIIIIIVIIHCARCLSSHWLGA